MGDRSLPAKLLIFASNRLSPAFAGLKIYDALTLGLAPQALCLRLLRRLKNPFLCKAARLRQFTEYFFNVNRFYFTSIIRIQTIVSLSDPKLIQCRISRKGKGHCYFLSAMLFS